MAIPGANDTAMFETFVEEVLVPELKPGEIVLWDNLEPHKAEEVVEIVEYETTARVAPHAERSAPRSDDTDARRAARRCFGRSDRSAQQQRRFSR